jgi:hypothetical protein
MPGQYPVLKGEQEPRRLKTVACQPRWALGAPSFGAALSFTVEPRGSSVRVGRCLHRGITDREYWTKALREARAAEDEANAIRSQVGPSTVEPAQPAIDTAAIYAARNQNVR